jgi:hypothetical protein
MLYLPRFHVNSVCNVKSIKPRSRFNTTFVSTMHLAGNKKRFTSAEVQSTSRAVQWLPEALVKGALTGWADTGEPLRSAGTRCRCNADTCRPRKGLLTLRNKNSSTCQSSYVATNSLTPATTSQRTHRVPITIISRAELFPPPLEIIAPYCEKI